MKMQPKVHRITLEYNKAYCGEGGKEYNLRLSNLILKYIIWKLLYYEIQEFYNRIVYNRKTWKQSTYPLKIGYINDLWYIHTMQHYASMNINKLLYI